MQPEEELRHPLLNICEFVVVYCFVCFLLIERLTAHIPNGSGSHSVAQVDL